MAMPGIADRFPRSAATALIAVVLAGLAAVAWSLLVRGPFLWHVSQPQYWQGAIEAVALWLLAFGALSLRAPVALRAALLLIPLALYLRRHHVDGVLLVSLLWLEGLLALGAIALRGARGEWLREFLAGVALCGLALWLAQAAGFGLPRTQRLLAIALLLPALAWRWRHWQTPALLRAALRDGESAGFRLAASATAVLLCALFARSNAVADFDSLWYGFRPERVLVGASSVFDALGLVSPVYYFPKFWEVLTLPLAAARETSLLQGAAILCGALLARLVHDALRALGHERTPALAGALLAWTIPAFSNVTLSAKPDVFAALCVVAMGWFAWQRWTRGDVSATPWGIAAAALAVSSKLAVLPYVAVAGLSLLAAARSPATPAEDRARRAGWAMVAVCALLGSLVCARTWLLAGMPTIGPEQLVAVWHALGMQLRLPVGTLEWVAPQNWPRLPAILYGWVLDPTRFSHLQISWPGHCWLAMALLALLLPRGPRPHPARWPLWLLPACGLALLIGIRFTNEGGDGNYFLAPVVIATVAAFDLLLRRAASPPLRRAALLAAACYAMFHFLYSFASAGWAMGTRSFDLDFSRSLRDSPDADAAELRAHGLEGVAQALRERGGRMRVWGRLDNAVVYRLPARTQPVTEAIFAHWKRRDEPGFLERLMACAGTQAWLLPAVPEPSFNAQVNAFTARLREREARHVLYRDERWQLVSIAGLLPRCEP